MRITILPPESSMKELVSRKYIPRMGLHITKLTIHILFTVDYTDIFSKKLKSFQDRLPEAKAIKDNIDRYAARLTTIEEKYFSA